MHQHIFDLKPTQLALGVLEVQAKVKHFKSFPKPELHQHLKKNRISVVVAPNRQTYIVDGHHHTAACWWLGIKRIKVNVVHDFSNSGISYRAFWSQMVRRKWCHLYDKFGDGPRDPMYLAPDIRGLGDDPYRSLAWLVKQHEGFQHTDIPFAQFQWANYFRNHRAFRGAFDLDYDLALGRALRLAKSPAARKLPGFVKIRK